MCGIVGAWLDPGLGEDLAGVLVDGLRTLEYRGYDSSGIGVLPAGPGGVLVRRKEGRLQNLEAELADGALAGALAGIGHTRWATHGEPSDGNAHPHTDGSGHMALVHNGIIENYAELRDELSAEGVEFQSETDTEVLAHLVGRAYKQSGDLFGALRQALGRVEGYFAVAVVGDRDGKRELCCARLGPPLLLSPLEGGVMLASDVLAVLPHSREVIYLNDGDVASLALDGGACRLHIESLDGEAGVAVERPVVSIDWDAEAASKGGYPHFMLKEIFEQGEVLGRAIEGRVLMDAGDVALEGDGWEDQDLNGIGRVQILACGTALHAGIVARYMIEGIARIPVEVDFASEYRYCDPVVSPGTLALGISQSGETADTLAAMRLARRLGAQTLAICNVQGSTLVRDCQKAIMTCAGPEIGVASTKAFSAQVVCAYLLAIRLGRARGALSAERGAELLEDLRHLRPKLETLLTQEYSDRVLRIAASHSRAHGFLFLGRGVNYPIALEGALKLKEISYVHAEGYAAGEMKHGPIALIEPALSTLVINTPGRVAEKVRANIEQVKARKGPVIAVGSDKDSGLLADDEVPVPVTSEWLSPLLNVVPLQLFSYHFAELRGCDIDKPRNLAKSVTVE